jgi:nitrogen fixation-related uncharacterized protein
MRQPLFRILLGIEYLIAVAVLIAFWSHAGGQYHLDLMFWPWKLAIPPMGAALIVAMTSELAEGRSWRSSRILLLAAGLALLMFLAGIVTYYYHVNEPGDQDDSDQPAQITRTRSVSRRRARAPQFLAVTVKVADLVAPPKAAEITALELVPDFCVRPENVALVFPACTLTLEGTVANAVLLLESVINAPPEGAALLRETVPLKLLPALTLAGFSATEETNTVDAGVIVTVA